MPATKQSGGKRKKKTTGKRKKKMNDFMKAKEKARKAGAESFTYTNKDGKTKTYKKFVMSTGMVAYKSK